MKFKKVSSYLLVVVLFSTTMAMAQHTVINTPPEVSPMPMKPEMTEIWEPQVSVVTPAKKLGDAPSDAIILFDGKNMDQWVSQKDVTKPAAWKIVNNDYMEVLVQNNTTINGLTLYSGLHNYPSSHGDDVISLQEHGCKTQFRNIWLRKL